MILHDRSVVHFLSFPSPSNKQFCLALRNNFSLINLLFIMTQRHKKAPGKNEFQRILRNPSLLSVAVTFTTGSELSPQHTPRNVPTDGPGTWMDYACAAYWMAWPRWHWRGSQKIININAASGDVCPSSPWCVRNVPTNQTYA